MRLWQIILKHLALPCCASIAGKTPPLCLIRGTVTCYAGLDIRNLHRDFDDYFTENSTEVLNER